MRIRKITSLTALLSFLMMLLTSLILYIVPQGRIAYWADWHLLGLTKEQWGAIHINIGLLFLLSLMLHIYYNWQPMIAYLKSSRKRIVIFTKEFNVAGMIVLAGIFGTYVEIPPFSTVLSINDGFKQRAAKKYGEPPYGHAELSSLATFTKKMGIDLDDAMNRLANNGIQVTNGTQTLKMIARKHRVSPRHLYDTMRPAQTPSSGLIEGARPLPDMPAPGTGNLTLSEFCARYQLELNAVLKSLEAQQIQCTEAMTIKEISGKNGISPVDVYEKLKSAAAG